MPGLLMTLPCIHQLASVSPEAFPSGQANLDPAPTSHPSSLIPHLDRERVRALETCLSVGDWREGEQGTGDGSLEVQRC